MPAGLAPPCCLPAGIACDSRRRPLRVPLQRPPELGAERHAAAGAQPHQPYGAGPGWEPAGWQPAPQPGRQIAGGAALRQAAQLPRWALLLPGIGKGKQAGPGTVHGLVRHRLAAGAMVDDSGMVAACRAAAAQPGALSHRVAGCACCLTAPAPPSPPPLPAAAPPAGGQPADGGAAAQLGLQLPGAAGAGAAGEQAGGHAAGGLDPAPWLCHPLCGRTAARQPAAVWPRGALPQPHPAVLGARGRRRRVGRRRRRRRRAGEAPDHHHPGQLRGRRQLRGRHGQRLCAQPVRPGLVQPRGSPRPGVLQPHGAAERGAQAGQPRHAALLPGRPALLLRLRRGAPQGHVAGGHRGRPLLVPPSVGQPPAAGRRQLQPDAGGARVVGGGPAARDERAGAPRGLVGVAACCGACCARLLCCRVGRRTACRAPPRVPSCLLRCRACWCAWGRSRWRAWRYG